MVGDFSQRFTSATVTVAADRTDVLDLLRSHDDASRSISTRDSKVRQIIT